MGKRKSARLKERRAERRRAEQEDMKKRIESIDASNRRIIMHVNPVYVPPKMALFNVSVC